MLKISIHLIKFCQIALWLISKLIVRHFLDVEIDKPRLELKSANKIVISNHITHLDPFIFIGCLSWKEMSAIRPIRPIIGRWYYHSPLFLIAYLIGCYPTKPLHPIFKKYSGTTAAIRYAKAGCTLGIYPEGQRIRGEKVEPKYGVIKILEHLESPDVVLCLLSKDPSDDKKFHITIRQNNSVGLLKDPKQIMDNIFRLRHTL